MPMSARPIDRKMACSGEFARMKIVCSRSAIAPVWLALVVVALLAAVHAHGQSTSASLHGAVRTAAGLPVTGASLLLQHIESGGGRTIVAGPDGTFALGNLTPGLYQLTAVKEGFANSSAIAVELAPG